MGVSSFDTKLDISFAVDVSSRSCNRKAIARIPLRVCSGVLGSAPTWKRVSARDANVGVVRDGASSPFAASQASPVPASGMSPVLLLICVAAPVRLVVLPFLCLGRGRGLFSDIRVGGLFRRRRCGVRLSLHC